MDIESLHKGLKTLDQDKFAKAIFHTIQKSQAPQEAEQQLLRAKDTYPAILTPAALILPYCEHTGATKETTNAMTNGANIAMVSLYEVITVARMSQDAQ